MAQTERRFEIISSPTDKIVFVTYATDEQTALDDYAAHRSGYCTLARMAQSAVFRDLADVRAEG